MLPFFVTALLCAIGCQTTSETHPNEEALAIFLNDMIPPGTTKEVARDFLDSNGYEFSFHEGEQRSPLSTGWESEERRFQGIVRDVRRTRWVSESIVFQVYLDENDRVREIGTHRALTGL